MAEEGLANLDKGKLAELKSFKTPPEEVKSVLVGIMIIMGKDTAWANIKKELSAPDFLSQM